MRKHEIERTEQVEEPLLWWPVWNLGGKNENLVVGGGEEKLIILYNLLQMIQDERCGKRVMRKGVKNNERTEQVEEQICGGQSEILVEKMRNDGWVGGRS